MISSTNNRSLNYKRTQSWNLLSLWLSFFMAFPCILVFSQNLSFLFIVGMFFFLMKNSKTSIFNLQKSLQWYALFFGLGAILSVLFIPYNVASDSIERALLVLPNYLYWSFLIILLVTHRNIMSLNYIYKGIFWGVIFTLVVYLFLQDVIQDVFFFNGLSPNSFSFILVCFTPIAVYYLWKTKGVIWALTFLSLLLIILFREERRAGIVLVFFGGFSAIYLIRIKGKVFYFISLFIPIIFFVMKSNWVESMVFKSSERMHEMLYKTGEIITEDQSYLTRVAMVKKGLAIFEKNPYTGIGLNNFANFSIDFDENFEGGQLVVNKEYIQSTSSHNSYINLLAEGGLFLLVPFILILATCLFHFISNYSSIPEKYTPVFIGVVTMSIHLYFISAIVNVFAWFLIALACSLVYTK